LKRTGFGQFLFYDWRFLRGRKEERGVYSGRAALRRREHPGSWKELWLRLLAEHAVWALADFGFRAVISSSFADIFANNSTEKWFPRRASEGGRSE